jgi:hypothetical protein
VAGNLTVRKVETVRRGALLRQYLAVIYLHCIRLYFTPGSPVAKSSQMYDPCDETVKSGEFRLIKAD